MEAHKPENLILDLLSMMRQCSFHSFAFPYFNSNKIIFFLASPDCALCEKFIVGGTTEAAELHTCHQPMWFLIKVQCDVNIFPTDCCDVIPSFKLTINHLQLCTIVSLSDREVIWSKVLLSKWKWMGFALLMQKWIK